jgi:MFS family permease
MVATLQIFRHRSFTLFLVARVLSTLGVQMQTVAVGWQVYATTRDPLDLGLVGLSQFLPFVLLILPAGHVADSHDRRCIFAACLALQCICAVLLLLLAGRELHSALPVFAVMMLFGVARAFAMPTGQALLPNLVPRDQLGAALAINTSVWQIATIAGPALGGIVYLAGPGTVYGSVAVLLGIGVVLTLAIRAPTEDRRSAEPLSRDALFSGLRFVRSRPLIFGAISLDLFAVLLGGATALLPAVASDVLHVGPAGLGWLRAAPGAGAAICGLVLSTTPISRRVGHWMFGGVVVFGAAAVVFGLSTSFWLSLAALVVMGAGDMVSVYIRHLLVQLETPDEIRGRVSAVNSVFIGASNELGEFESGVMAAIFGTVPAVVIGGCATLGVAVLWTRLFPGLWSLDQFREVHVGQEPARG